LQIVGHIIGPPEFIEQAILGNGGLGDRLNHLVEPEPRPKRWQRSYLLQAFSAALAGIRKRYRQ